ncbi:MAG: DNA alkylation repair protein [Longibaculum sp.]
MTSQDIIEKLKQESSEKYKANVIKMGIPEENSIGVPTSQLRTIAKEIGKSNEIAYELWKSGYHDAKLLAVLVFEVKKLSFRDIDQLMNDVISWDLCNFICKQIIMKRKDYGDFIEQWIDSNHVYKKRAAFVLIGSAVIKNKTITFDTLDQYLYLIQTHLDYDHEHVKKAVSYALREIGKKDFEYNEKVLLMVNEMLQTQNKTQIWIARDVKKELENVVEAKGRERLISRQSKMGEF